MHKSLNNATPENGNAQDKEFSRGAVPPEQRRGFVNLLSVILGLVIVATTMQVGGIIGDNLDFNDAVGAVLLSSGILAVLGAFMGAIGSKTGLTFGLLSKYSFGELGTWLPVAIVAVTTIGWFSIDAWLIGDATHQLFNAVPVVPIIILSGIGMTLTALFGISWMGKLSNVAVPLIVICCMVSIVIAFKSVGGVAGFQSVVPAGHKTFAECVSLGVGSYAVGAIMFTPDVLRYAKSQKAAIIIMVVSMLVANSFVLLFGVFGALASGKSDITVILAFQGLLAPAFLVLVFNIWSTAQGCVYSGSLSLTSKLKGIKRERIVAVFGVIGIVLALAGFYEHFGSYINFLASLVPAIAGVMISDFFVRYRSGYPDIERHRFNTVDYRGFIAWGAGILVYFFLPFGLPAVSGVVASFAVRSILCLKRASSLRA